jgi:hypothetical protein
MSHVAIVCKPHKEELAQLLPKLIDWLRAHGYEPVVDREGGQYTNAAPVVARAEMPGMEPGLVVVLGGDGTLLGVARLFASNGAPILSVNLGHLGFLTEVRLADLYSTLDGWCAGCHELDLRAMLHAEVWREGEQLSGFEALNEVVVSKADIARMGDFAVELDGKSVASFRADRLDGLYSGRQWTDSDAQCGRAGGHAHLPAPADAAAHRSARQRLVDGAGGGHSEPGPADRGRAESDGARVGRRGALPALGSHREADPDERRRLLRGAAQQAELG